MGKSSSKQQKDRPLSARERLFCHELSTPGTSQHEAARRAGYHGNDRTLASTASRLLTRANVRELYGELCRGNEKKAEERKEKVLAEIHHVALARLSRVLEPDGKLKPLDSWGEDEKAALSELEVEEIYALAGPSMTDDGLERGPGIATGRVSTLKMAGKLKALELAAKHHGLIVDKSEVDVNVKGHAAIAEEVLRRVRERRQAPQGSGE